MDSSWAQAFQGGGREACSPLYHTHTSYQGATWGGKKLKAQLMGKPTDSLFSVSQVAPLHLLLSPSCPTPPPCPWAATAVSTKLSLRIWPSDENQLDENEISLYEPHLSRNWTNRLVIGRVIHSLPLLNGLLPRGHAIEWRQLNYKGLDYNCTTLMREQ